MKYFEIATTNVEENDQENDIVGFLPKKINDLVLVCESLI